MNTRADLLLETALTDSPARLRACWQAWRERVPDLDNLQKIEHRLLPYVWRRLHEAGLADTDHQRLRGIYKKTWFYNHHLLSMAASLQQELRDIGIDSVLFKGGAMMLMAYTEIGLRASSDIDLYIRPKDFPQAHHLLRARYKRGSRSDHAVQFSAPERAGVDLHWATSRWDQIHADAELSANFVQRSNALRWRDKTFVVPDPTDLLFHSLNNAFAHTPPTVNSHRYWLIDARELATRTELDAERLLSMIKSLRCVPLWQHQLAAVEPYLTPSMRTLHQALLSTPLSSDERRLDEALRELRDRGGDEHDVNWELTLRGVPRQGGIHSVLAKGRSLTKRIRLNLIDFKPEMLGPLALRRKFRTALKIIRH